jgi:transposase
MEAEVVVNDTLRQHGFPESEMINRDKHGAVVELAARGTPKKVIARMLDIDPKTVRGILAKKEWTPYKRRPSESTVLSGFEDFLTRRAPEVDFNAVVLFREAKGLGFTGCYEAIKVFVRPMREERRLAMEATLRFETAPGRQGQVDWGTSSVWFGERRVRTRFFALVLGYSRRMFAKGFPNERLASLTAGHEAAFAWFGGSPRELLYDNPKTIVKNRDRETGEVEMNPAFRDFLRHYGVTPRFCRPYRARTKGKIESGIKYIKKNFLAGRRFRDLDDLNRQLEEWLVTVADVRVHGTTGVRPIDRFPQEKLLDLSHAAPYRLESPIRRQVGSDARVAFRANRYSVPWRLAGREVELRTEGDEVVLVHDGAVVARHALLSGRFQERVDPAHFRGLFRMIVEEEGSKPLHDPRFPVEDVMVRDLSLYDRVAGIGGAL